MTLWRHYLWRIFLHIFFPKSVTTVTTVTSTMNLVTRCDKNGVDATSSCIPSLINSFITCDWPRVGWWWWGGEGAFVTVLTVILSTWSPLWRGIHLYFFSWQKSVTTVTTVTSILNLVTRRDKKDLYVTSNLISSLTYYLWRTYLWRIFLTLVFTKSVTTVTTVTSTINLVTRRDKQGIYVTSRATSLLINDVLHMTSLSMTYIFTSCLPEICDNGDNGDKHYESSDTVWQERCRCDKQFHVVTTTKVITCEWVWKGAGLYAVTSQ